MTSIVCATLAFSEKYFFTPDSSGAFIKAFIEMHELITSTCYRIGIAICSMLLQKQQIKRNLKHPLFVLDFNNFDFLPLNYPPDQRS